MALCNAQVGQRVWYAVESGFERGFKSHFGRVTAVEVDGQRTTVEVLDEDDGKTRRFDSWHVSDIEDGKKYARLGTYFVEAVVVSSTVKRTKVQAERVDYRHPRRAVWADRLNVLLALPDGTRVFGIAPKVAQKHGVEKGDVIRGVIHVKSSAYDGYDRRREDADDAFGFITGWGDRFDPVSTRARLYRNGVEVGREEES